MISMKEQSILWRRVDTPGHESALVYGDDDGWYLDGAAVFLHESSPCRLEYMIECDLDWRTRSVSVDGWVGGDVVECEIEVSEDGIWSLNDKLVSEVDGCLDIDLNFSPITNLLPLRRLDPATGESKTVRAAWLRFPTFKLEPLDQSYTRLDASTVEYESGGGAFVRRLKVNDVGLVLEYPDYWMVEGVLNPE
jgi:hypothetical protein